jgi:hypothetical protein
VLLNSEGTLFVYLLRRETALLLQMLSGVDIKDANGSGFKSPISTMDLFNTRPPAFDKFVLHRTKDRDAQCKPIERADSRVEGEFLVLECQSGVMVIVEASAL